MGSIRVSIKNPKAKKGYSTRTADAVFMVAIAGGKIYVGQYSQGSPLQATLVAIDKLREIAQSLENDVHAFTVETAEGIARENNIPGELVERALGAIFKDMGVQ